MQTPTINIWQKALRYRDNIISCNPATHPLAQLRKIDACLAGTDRPYKDLFPNEYQNMSPEGQESAARVSLMGGVITAMLMYAARKENIEPQELKEDAFRQKKVMRDVFGTNIHAAASATYKETYHGPDRTEPLHRIFQNYRLAMLTR